MAGGQSAYTPPIMGYPVKGGTPTTGQGLIYNALTEQWESTLISSVSSGTQTVGNSAGVGTLGNANIFQGAKMTLGVLGDGRKYRITDIEVNFNSTSTNSVILGAFAETGYSSYKIMIASSYKRAHNESGIVKTKMLTSSWVHGGTNIIAGKIGDSATTIMGDAVAPTEVEFNIASYPDNFVQMYNIAYGTRAVQPYVKIYYDYY